MPKAGGTKLLIALNVEIIICHMDIVAQRAD